MGDCCEPDGYDRMFSKRFARRTARRYRKHGLSRSATALTGFLTERGIEGATVLEIGGGVGHVQVELLRRGAARAVNLEISTSYEAEAEQLLEQAGLGDRVERRVLDIAQSPDEVETADVVVLHRVVCCYPDYQRLLTAAGSKADRMLVLSHPPRNVATRVILWLENAGRRVKGDTFRSFAHPPDQMLAALGDTGLRASYRWRGFGWCVVGLER
jgi:magnesium-protoporphyrin O-methyltransferase